MASMRVPRRCFQMRPTDRRFAHASLTTRKVRFQLPTEQLGVRKTIEKALKAALAASYTSTTKSVHNTHLSYWRDFCRIARLAPHDCFSHTISVADTAALNAETNILGAFLAFVVMHPRQGEGSNPAAYALQILSTVRSFFQDRIGRKPGIAIEGLASGNLRAVITGLRSTAPSAQPKRGPIQQFHLWALKMQLDLVHSQFHRVAWAL